MACTTETAQAAVWYIAAHGATINQMRVASRLQYLPNSQSVDVLAFSKPSDSEKPSYRVIIIDLATASSISSRTAQYKDIDTLPEPQFSLIISPAELWSEAATKGLNGTDFIKETPSEKTLLHFYATIPSLFPFWQKARVYVIECPGVGLNAPTLVGSFDTVLSSSLVCLTLSVVTCAIFYCCAALATFYKRKSQRRGVEGTGINYAGWIRHFDPVVLTAGSDGRGSPTKLQILFFSLVVFGLVSYIWMLTGHLTGLSTTVLLLMGISGLGATASAGTELSRNRLDFDKWAFLIDRGWLPEGGVAESNMAQWKDIVTTDGEFDVYRFQMVTFSVLVGIALVGAGTQLTDLASFDIPQALLGILGLSQVVYVAGKLVAPPSLSDLNTQIGKLQGAEKNLRDKLDVLNASFLAERVVWLNGDETIKVAIVAYSDYLQTWETTRTMYQSTLGRLVPEGAVTLRPPFPVPHVVGGARGKLPNGKLNNSYEVSFLGAGGSAPYVWTLSDGALPAGLSLSTDGHLSGTPSEVGDFKFALQIQDSAGAAKSKDFTISIVKN